MTLNTCTPIHAQFMNTDVNFNGTSLGIATATESTCAGACMATLGSCKCGSGPLNFSVSRTHFFFKLCILESLGFHQSLLACVEHWFQLLALYLWPQKVTQDGTQALWECAQTLPFLSTCPVKMCTSQVEIVMELMVVLVVQSKWFITVANNEDWQSFLAQYNYLSFTCCHSAVVSFSLLGV